MNLDNQFNVLEFFYGHVDEDDWNEGLDLYQAGRVSNIQDFDGLIYGEVRAFAAGATEVRLKIHPHAKCVQWIECGCKKNRAKGIYCEHIAAFMIHIDREVPKLLGNLDSKMPLKPPASKKKSEKKKNQAIVPEKVDSTTDIIDKFKGSIQSVSLLAHGPSIRVRLEIKDGQLTQYDLGLDQAAEFLKGHQKLKCFSPELKNLKIYSTEATFGTKFDQVEDEKIKCEKVIAIRKIAKRNDKGSSEQKYRKFEPGVSKPKEQVFEFHTFKNISRYIGEKYVFIPEKGYWPIGSVNNSDAWDEIPLTKSFKNDDIAKLYQRGFKEFIDAAAVFLSGELKEVNVMNAQNFSEVKVKASKNGWFTLDPMYKAGATSVSMIDLIKEYKKSKRKFFKKDDTWVKIPEFVTEHNWEIDDKEGLLKVDTLGMLRIKAAMGETDQFAGSKKALSEVRQQLDFDFNPDPPKLTGTKLSLRPYQETGLNWFWWLYKNRLHGLLADEMGLGKTHQAMALMASILNHNKKGKFLVIVPTTVLDHWYDKILEFCPNINPLIYHGPKRGLSWNKSKSGTYTIVTSYGVLLRDIADLSEIHFDAIILDEAHLIKNNATSTYKAGCKLNGSIRLCLTGTPMENHLGELKSIFDFLIPGYLGSDSHFKKKFISPLEKEENRDLELELQKIIHPFKLRRTKDQVLKDLPEKVEDIRHCTLSSQQVKLYQDTVKLKSQPLIDQLEESDTVVPYLHVFTTISILKQICNHPALVTKQPWQQYESGKFELLKEILEEALGSGHKVVIYTQYIGMIQIISEYLDTQKINHVTLSGKTRNRGKVISEFQNNENVKVFIGSLLAGGVGVDLTSASVVIHYDRWWNASKENQATDRVHRIGQNKNVQVMKMVTRGTLEERIDELIRSKSKIFDSFLNKDEDVFKKLTREELINLLQ